MIRSLFVVEGPHEVEAIGVLLKRHKLARVTLLEALDPFWAPLVPRTFPHAGDLHKRVPVPTFFASDARSVAVQSAEGIDNIERAVHAALTVLDAEPAGVGIVLDADHDEPVEARWRAMASKLPDLKIEGGPGVVTSGSPRAGVFVLPDNAGPGTLEDVLLACAAEVYPTLLEAAKRLVEPLDASEPTVFKNSDERKHFAKPSGKPKAIVGCVASVLRPGKAIQVSIQDNLWLREPRALALPHVIALDRFVLQILG